MYSASQNGQSLEPILPTIKPVKCSVVAVWWTLGNCQKYGSLKSVKQVFYRLHKEVKVWNPYSGRKLEAL